MKDLRFCLLILFIAVIPACGALFEGTEADETELLTEAVTEVGELGFKGDADAPEFGRFLPGPEDTIRTGERFPSVGEMRVSLIFARFEGDNRSLPEWSERPNPNDPEDIPVWMNLFLSSGPDDRTGENHYENITNYFNQSSFGNLRIYGDTYHVAVPDSFIGRRYGDANRYVIQSLFGDGDGQTSRVSRPLQELDNWANPRQNVHIQEADGVVDYIIVIYRRPRGMPHPFGAAWSGIAGLGFGDFDVDEGMRVRPSGNNVSGATGTLPDRASAFGFMVHEIGHHLIGSPHPYRGSAGAHPAYWGIFDTFLSNQSINAYERDLLGWNPLQDLENSSEIQTVRMRDYYTTGDALRFQFDDGTAFIFENRQKLIQTRGAAPTYDLATINETDKGLFVYRVNPPYSTREHNLRTFPADGHHIWEVRRLSDSCGSRFPQPAFRNAGQNPWGQSFRDVLVLDLEAHGLQGNNPFPMFINDDLEFDRCHTYTRGQYFDVAFGPGSNSGKRLFNSFTNPASLDEEGNYSGISFYIHEAEGTDGELTVSFSTDPFFRDLGRALQVEQDIFFKGDAVIPDGAELHLADGINIYMQPDSELLIDGIILLPDSRLLTGRFTFEDLSRIEGLSVRELTPENPYISREPMN
ncbi:MAG: hypothetical protein LAT84_10810 [Balneolia bacterium]|nr:hypothetical protein [Balneolia bacterium]